MENKVEINALRDIIDGFNKQAVAIPTIALRFLELEGNFSTEEVEEAGTLYKDILTTKFSGRNVLLCQVATFMVLAELVIQARVKKPKVEEPNPAYQ